MQELSRDFDENIDTLDRILNIKENFEKGNGNKLSKGDNVLR